MLARKESIVNMRVNAVTFRGTVESRDLAAQVLARSGDVVLVLRGTPRLLILRCPCGCGDDLLINVDRRAGPAWRYYLNRKGLTLFPSYWRDAGCGSHFILWNSHIYWCSGWESDESDYWSVPREIEEAVLEALPQDHFVEYEEIAQQLDLIPWEALQACRQLVKRGLAERLGYKGEFRRTGGLLVRGLDTDKF